MKRSVLQACCGLQSSVHFQKWMATEWRVGGSQQQGVNVWAGHGHVLDSVPRVSRSLKNHLAAHAFEHAQAKESHTYGKSH